MDGAEGEAAEAAHPVAGMGAQVPRRAGIGGATEGLEPRGWIDQFGHGIVVVGAMVVGELAPKSLALQFPTQVALYSYWPMRWSLWILGPFIWFLNGSGTLLLKLLGSSHGAHRHVHSPEEIELLKRQLQE